MILALFDFDGTISTRDTTMDFIYKSFGAKKKKSGTRRFIIQIPLLFIKLRTLKQIKESYIRYFFKGKNYEEFLREVKDYTEKTLPKILIPSAIERIKWHKNQGHEIAVVSGSTDVFLKDFCNDQGINLITNSLEVIDGKITGKINEQYCFGPGKVELIKKHYNLDNAEYIYAYGNSRGDREMLAIADEKFYQYFKKKNI